MATTEFKSTVSGATSVLTPRLAERGVSNTQRALRRLRKHRMALFGLALLVFVFLYVLIGSLLIPDHVLTLTIGPSVSVSTGMLWRTERA
jgi:hypothetical protein